MQRDVYIRIEKISKDYDKVKRLGFLHPLKSKAMLGANKRPALDGVSLSIPRGKIFVLMGLSGSGKSTLLRCINRLVEPSSGKIYIDGQDVTQLTSRNLRSLRNSTVGMVFQHFALLPHLTILDNVALGLRISKFSKAERQVKALEVIQQVGLAGWENHKPSELSGGMQQRVGIARALVMDTPILLMDEPFSALDPLIRVEMQQELLRLQRLYNKTIVFVTHDPNEAIILGDEIAILKDGKVVQHGDIREIRNTPANEYVRNFFKSVNSFGVGTAKDAVDETVLIMPGREQAYRSDSTVLVDKGNSMLGVVSGSRIDSERKLFNKWHSGENYVTVGLDTPISEILNLNSEWRELIAVVEPDGRFYGAITPVSLLKHISSSTKATDAVEPATA